MAQQEDIDAVLCLGCVIQGETRHFEFICQAVSQGITNVGLKYNKPVIFGLLTTDNYKQAMDRAGGRHGNKGDEAAITAVKMLGFVNNFGFFYLIFCKDIFVDESFKIWRDICRKT